MANHRKNLWTRLTEAPPSITDPRQRQQSRLNSILCLSAVIGGTIGVSVSYYGATGDSNLTNNPLFIVLLITSALTMTAYFLGRSPRTLHLAAILLVLIVIFGNFWAVLINPEEFVSLTIYTVLGDIFASLLLSPRGTRITVVLSLAVLLIYPLVLPQISLFTVLRSFGPIFVVSIMIVIGVTVRQRDLRTIEQQARKLDEARNEAESANKLKGVFLGMISHELRTPLNNIVGYSDQMLMGVRGELTDGLKEAAERIHRNGAQLNRMVNDLLMLSRLEGGSLAIVHRVFAPADLLIDIDGSFHDQAQEKGLALVTSIDPTLPHAMHGDYQRIAQIVLNLVSNAAKFTDQGQITVDIHRMGPDEWAVDVTDTGIGIPADVAARIFERFYQVDSTSKRSHGGAGLGLAIARELALLMGGSVTLRSAINTGSVFTLTLPIALHEQVGASQTPAEGLPALSG